MGVKGGGGEEVRMAGKRVTQDVSEIVAGKTDRQRRGCGSLSFMSFHFHNDRPVTFLLTNLLFPT